MRKNLFVISMICFLGPALLSAQGEIKPIKVQGREQAAVVMDGREVSIGDAIRHALDANKDIIVGSYEVAMSDSDYIKYSKKYSPFLGFEAGTAYQKNPEISAGDNGDSEKSMDTTLSINQMLPTATTLSAGIQYQYSRTKYSTSLRPVQDSSGNTTGDYACLVPEGTYAYHSPAFFVGIRQELLRNAFGYNDRRERKILKNAQKMKKDNVIYQLSGLVIGVIIDYWDLILKNEQLENATLLLNETRYVSRVVARNVRYGINESYDLNYYNALVARAEAQKTAAEQAQRDSLKKFLRTTSLDEKVDISGSAIFADKLPEINVDDAIARAFAKRADYLNAIRSVQNAKMQLEIVQNQGLPSMSAEINASSYSLREGMDDALGDTAAGEYPSIEARFRVTHPLTDPEQETNERNALFGLKQAKVNLEKIKREVRDQVISKIENINTTYTVYQKAKEARSQSEKFYRSMAKNLRRGRMSAAVVRDALDGLVQSREGELMALIQYNISLLEYEIAKNELFDTYSIDVDKYIPKK